MNKIKIFACSNESELIAKKICKDMHIELGNVTRMKFKNDNNFVQFNEPIRSSDIFLVQTMNRPVNERVMELLIMIDAAKRSSAKSITVVLPYFPYSRSDKKDQPRIPITAKLMANLLESAGVNRVITCDLHNPAIQSYFEIPCDVVTCQHLLESYFEKISHNKMVIVATDAGSSKKAYKYAKFFDADIALVNKVRLENTDNVSAKSLIGNVKNRIAVIFDDEIDTGGSIMAAAKILEKNGASKIVIGCTHGVLSDGAIDKIDKSNIQELVITDTIPHKEINSKKVTVLQTSKIFAEAIKRISEDDPDDSIFER